MKKQLLFLVMMSLPLVAMADANGKCGTNLTWTYTEATQTLTIKGAGAMADYNYSSKAPWDSYSNVIEKIIIGPNATTIGNFAFSNCYGLTHISIGSGVTNIGYKAFEFCNNMKDMYIYAEQLPSMSSETFYNANISKVTLHVPANMLFVYQSISPWKDFGAVVAIDGDEYQGSDPAGIQNNTLNKDANSLIYNLNGKRLEAPQRGISIINGQKGSFNSPY